MKEKQRIVCKDRREFEVIKELGSGGQGSAWVVRECNGARAEYVLKIITDKLPDRRRKKVENIRRIKDDSPRLTKLLEGREFTVALPLSLYERDGEFGYIMEKCQGVEINKLMLEHKFDNMPIADRLKIVNRVAESADWLRRSGYCYQDFSHKNFMYDEARKHVSVIDCDNVTASSAARDGKTFVKGTAFYMAPEVAFNKCNHSIESDNFALATLLFKIMTGSTDSPYHGKELYTKRPKPTNMRDAAIYTEDDPSYGKDWLTFIFDPVNKVNEAKPEMFKNPETRARQALIVKNWRLVPDNIKDMFCLAFKNPLDPEARKRRPTAGDWYQATLPQANNTVPKTKATPAPKAVEPPKQPSVQKDCATVILAGGKTQSVTDVYKVLTPNGKPFGTVEKNENGYIYTSDTVYTTKYWSTKKSGTLAKGECIALESNTDIFNPMRPEEKITVKLP